MDVHFAARIVYIAGTCRVGTLIHRIVSMRDSSDA
jgi:hypothetical protein